MAVCPSNCASLPPPSPDWGCIIGIRSGQISRIVIMSCDIEFVDINNPLEWCQYVYEGKITLSPIIKGEIGAPSVTTEDPGGCSAEVKTGETTTMSFESIVADLVANTDFDFWYDLDTKYLSYKFGLLDCAGNFYGFIENATFKASWQTPNTKNSPSKFAGDLMWNYKTPKPIIIPNIESILKGNCSNIPGFDACPEITGISGIAALCAYDGLTLSVPYYLNASYQWTRGGDPLFGETTNTLVVTEPDTYNVTITRAGCSTPTLANAVITDSRPDVTLIANANPGEVVITATGTGTLGYYIAEFCATVPEGGDYQTSNTFTGVPIGSHCLYVRDENGCVRKVEFPTTI